MTSSLFLEADWLVCVIGVVQKRIIEAQFFNSGRRSLGLVPVPVRECAVVLARRPFGARNLISWGAVNTWSQRFLTTIFPSDLRVRSNPKNGSLTIAGEKNWLKSIGLPSLTDFSASGCRKRFENSRFVMPHLVIGNSRAIFSTDKREAALYLARYLLPSLKEHCLGHFIQHVDILIEKLPELLWSLFRTWRCTGLNIFLNVGFFLCLNR